MCVWQLLFKKASDYIGKVNIIHRQKFTKQSWHSPFAPGFLSFGRVTSHGRYTSKYPYFNCWFGLSWTSGW